MCRATYLGFNGRVFFGPLKCTTNADKLYSYAVAVAESQGFSLVAVEPCMLALRSAVAAPEELHKPS